MGGLALKAFFFSIKNYFQCNFETAVCVQNLFSLTADSGADDLVPVISYVVMQSRLPQLVSECHAMSEFIHEG